MFESIMQNALTLFIVANPIGNTPSMLALVKDFPFGDQRRILLREGAFFLLIAIFFQYLGEGFLNLLAIQKYVVSMCGGIILFLIALKMIFSLSGPKKAESLNREPFIVPIATPILAGAGLLSIIVFKANLSPHPLNFTCAILLAWAGVMGVMFIAPYLPKLLGRRGLSVCEQFMGLLLAILSMNMLVNGITLFIKTSLEVRHG